MKELIHEKKKKKKKKKKKTFCQHASNRKTSWWNLVLRSFLFKTTTDVQRHLRNLS